MSTIFDRIIQREIEADVVYEDDLALAFRDVAPQAPTHILVIPKKPVVNVASAADDDEDLLGHLLMVVRNVARDEGLADDGYRIVVNNGVNGGQSVDHLHFHILGGRKIICHSEDRL